MKKQDNVQLNNRSNKLNPNVTKLYQTV